GFATTADAHRDFLRSTGVDRLIADTLEGLDTSDIDALQKAGRRIRHAILDAELGPDLTAQIADAYRKLEAEYGPDCDVAVRSSATAEDLPEASFAGQQETYLNIRGERMLL